MSRASIHCFGKLPIAGDFIHYKLDAEEARGFSEWMQKGHSLVEGITRGTPSRGTPAPGAPEPERRYRFAYDNGLGKRIVFGILKESTDRGKLRRFPFAVYGLADAAPFRERPALMPLLLRPAWEALDAEAAELPSVASVEAMFKRLDGLVLEIPDGGRAAQQELERTLTSTQSGALWGAMLNGSAKERRVAVFNILAQALSAARNVKPAEVSVALKLPLAGSAGDVALQGAFWIELLSAVVKNPRQTPNVFLAAPGPSVSPSSLHVFFQKPDERNFGSLMTRSYESEYVDDLTAIMHLSGAHLVLGEPQRRLLERDDANLMELTRFRWL